MRAHIIDGGIVVNTIEVDSLDFMPRLVAAIAGEGIGWSYDGQAFVPPSAPPAPAPTVPQSVSRAQGRPRSSLPDCGPPCWLTSMRSLTRPTRR